MINQHVAVEQSQGPVTATCDVDPACCSGQEQSQGPVTATCDVDPACCSGQEQQQGSGSATKSRKSPKAGPDFFFLRVYTKYLQ